MKMESATTASLQEVSNNSKETHATKRRKNKYAREEGVMC
jgi:hypothetical protein